MPNLDSKYFCAAPWVHVCQNVGGRLKPCCRFYSTVDFIKNEKTTIKDFFFGEEMNNLRETMLSDQPHAGCTKCYNEDASGKSSLRQQLNEAYKDKLDLDNPKIFYLEVGLSNACNLKCVTCASNYSTSWYEDDLELKRRNFYREDAKEKFVITDKEYLNIDVSSIERVKILGGEPFMEPRNLELLELLDQHGRIENMRLEIVTNATVMPNEKWIGYLERLKDLQLSISLDGIEDTAEFVRHGTNWSKLAKNTLWWRDFCSQRKHNFQFHFVIHAFNALNIQETVNWVESNHGNTLLNFDCLFGPKYLNVSYLPQWYKDKIIEQAKYIKRQNNRDYVIKFINSNTYDQENQQTMIKYLEHLEHIRDTPINSKYKENILKIQ